MSNNMNIYLYSGHNDVTKALASRSLASQLIHNYGSKTLLPRRNVSGSTPPTKLTMRLKPSALIALNENDQMIILASTTKLEWRDEYLTWDPNDHCNVTKVDIHAEDIWLPDLTLYNNVDVKFIRFPPDTTLKVHHTGMVSWYIPVITSSLCILQGHYFPFDQQVCSLTFGSWSNDVSKLEIVADTSPDAREVVFQSNKVWELTKFESSSYLKKYDCCMHEFSHLVYKITFRRQPSFYVITICFPCAALSLLLLVVFWVPHEAGEKISMATDSLLALILFQQLVATLRPPSGNGLQVLGKSLKLSVLFADFYNYYIYFLTMIILSCTTIASSVVVRSLYFGKGKGLPPKLIRKLTHSRLCAIFIEVPHTADELDTLEQSISSATEKQFGDLFYDEELVDRERKWRAEYEKRKERAAGMSRDMSQRKKATCLRELMGPDDKIDNTQNEFSEEDFARELEKAKRKENLDMYVLMRELTKQRPSVEDIKEKEKYKREWKLVAKAIDRIVFLIHMVATIGITVYVYTTIASNIELRTHEES
ncbi:Neuronal acetylcholine receptor subunit alpha-9 [Holothuria leucospilota]|uniref:Neuronal acetylcholine receptor subunit alpha-9 n=1 Tax=Holothuria leucospilota TaxID=206669 RepID=A0A9Q1CI73_HOLLE|nr:Neuronal acetylcholine receptor subunit alpha-9 [Holothuria leucospilota]